MRRIARSLKHLPARLMHAPRRHRAMRRVSSLPSEAHLVVLCLGNICRSPYAAARLEAELDASGNGRVSVESAGFIGPDRSPPAVAREVSLGRGIDLSGHRSSLISGERASTADLLIVMTPQQARRLRHSFGLARDRILVLGDLDPAMIETRAIPDPFDRPKDVFEAVFERVDRCARAFGSAYRSAGPRPRSSTPR